MADYKLLKGDCLELMRGMTAVSVDMVMTSPPYDNLRTYKGVGESWNFDKFKEIANELFRLLKPGGVIVWIVNDATIGGSETGTSFRQALYFKEIGFNLHDTMIWHKSMPYPGNTRYWPSFEYMLVLSKGAPKYTHIIKDRKNKHAGEDFKNKSYRMADGSLIGMRKNAPTKIPEYSERENVWDMSGCVSSVERTGHPAQYPLRLAQDHIISWSKKGDVVLDPFSGSGTTGVACLNTGRNFIGMEIVDEYFAIAEKRLAEAKEKADAALFADDTPF